jgi:hypothetical protein
MLQKSGLSESDDVSSSGGDSSFDSSDSDFLDFPIETLLKGARRKSASDTRQLKRYQNKNKKLLLQYKKVKKEDEADSNVAISIVQESN